ncbi:hypothetical protein BGX34_011002 [Mortierella sp. NVP85]|nr:hypothetical protein BGX34_011002 [Mortierella sp. NVP85]
MTSSNTFVAPLSASSLQAYNQMNASIMKRKAEHHHDHDNDHNNHLSLRDPKRPYLERGGYHVPSGTRQRQESGCSIMSASSWSSSASFSTVSSSSASSSPSSSPVSVVLPDMASSPRTRSLSSASRSPSPVESDEEYNNPLWHICDAIALAEKQDDCKKTTSGSHVRSDRFQSGSMTIDNGHHHHTHDNYNHNYNKTSSDDGLKIVFLEPNWLAEHMAKSKKIAALKKQQQLLRQ